MNGAAQIVRIPEESDGAGSTPAPSDWEGGKVSGQLIAGRSLERYGQVSAGTLFVPVAHEASPGCVIVQLFL
jgi:hypothetical protein